MLVARRSSLSRARALAFLAGLEEEMGPARTVYLPPGMSAEEVLSSLQEAEAQEVAPLVCDLAAGSRTGAALFWGESAKYLLAPPFPVDERRLESGFVVQPLKDLLGRSLKIAVVLVRLRSYAVGLCHGEALVASKVGAGNIHARHRQGGSSSARFARHREKQIEGFMTRVCGHVEEILETEARSIDYAAYGGSSEGIRLLRKSCAFLHQFDGRELPPLLDLEEPRQRVLEQAITRVWTSRVVEWREEDLPQSDTTGE